MAFNWRRIVDTDSARRNVDEIKELGTRYLKEETIEPVKNLGRFAAWGCLGSLLVGLGSLLLLLGVLRLLQTETAVFRGDLSWLPYLIVVLLALAEMAVMGWRIVSGPAKRRQKSGKKGP